MREAAEPVEPDTDAATVAVAMTWRKAERSPDMNSGSAQGISTRRSTSAPRIPIPLAASRAAGSTSSMPA